MQDYVNKRVWLVGAGRMAIEYAAVLKDMGVKFNVIGRSKKSADIFESETGVMPFVGGLKSFLAEANEPAGYAIVATDIMSLDSSSITLVQAGVENILIEKPGSLSKSALERLQAAGKANRCKIYIAYNRRFYSSVQTLSEMANSDGGISSCFFEFSELSNIVSKLKIDEELKHNWFLANSTHVVDLVFSLIGSPLQMKAYQSAGLDWHTRSGIFVGAGISEHNVPFSWHSNWTGPGRWGIEFVTSKNRYHLRPMEELHITAQGKSAVTQVAIDSRLDLAYKPGLYKQVNSFLLGGCGLMCDLKQHLKHWDFYMKIAGYVRQ